MYRKSSIMNNECVIPRSIILVCFDSGALVSQPQEYFIHIKYPSSTHCQHQFTSVCFNFFSTVPLFSAMPLIY